MSTAIIISKKILLIPLKRGPARVFASAQKGAEELKSAEASRTLTSPYGALSGIDAEHNLLLVAHRHTVCIEPYRPLVVQ